MLLLIAADRIAILPDSRLRAELTGPGQMQVGRPGVLGLALRAEGHSRPLEVQALLEQSGEADAPVPVAGILRDGRLALSLPLAPRRRGRIVIAAFWLRWRAPLGLIEARTRRPAGKTIDVLPAVYGIREAALQFFSQDAVHGMKNQRLQGEGTEFETLREYAAGMDSRFIDWKRSARHRKLLCKEFRQERNQHIVFGFDTGRLMLEPTDGMPRLDHAVRAGLLLGWVSLRSGDYVGGCSFDSVFRSFLRPGRNMAYFTQLQSFAAELAYRAEETNMTPALTGLHSRLRRRALIILFTDFVDRISAELLLESLQPAARRHVIIFVTMRDPLLARLQSAPPADFLSAARAVIAGDFLRERAIVLERILRLGVHVLDVPARDVSGALLNRYLLIKQRGLL